MALKPSYTIILSHFDLKRNVSSGHVASESKAAFYEEKITRPLYAMYAANTSISCTRDLILISTSPKEDFAVKKENFCQNWFTNTFLRALKLLFSSPLCGGSGSAERFALKIHNFYFFLFYRDHEIIFPRASISGF